MGRVWFVLALLGCSGAQRSSEPIRADLVLTNGNIYTGDPARPRVEALAIRGDRIVAIGTNQEILRFAAPRSIDLVGRLVIPGINDAHVHEPALDAALFKGGDHAIRMVELPGEFDTLTVADMLVAIERAAHEQPAGTWLRAELSRAAIDDPALTREALDRVAPNHPVWIDNFAGHALVLNSAAMRAAGIDPSAAPPRGGFIGRTGNGANDGWRFEYARYEALRSFGAKVRDDDVLAAIRDFEQHAAQFGITSVQTLPIQIEPTRLDDLLRTSPRSLRWHVMRLPVGEIIMPPYLLALVEKGVMASPELEGMVTLYGTKYFLDGTPIERGAALLEPYSDQRPELEIDKRAPSGEVDKRPISGHADWDAAAIREMLVRARASGDPLHLHIAGDVQLARLLDQMEELDRAERSETLKRAAVPGRAKADWPIQRVVIEHGDAIAPADIPRIRALGIVVVQNPSHAMPADLNRARLGDRTARWMPMRSLIAAGIPFALGSDGPLNPYLNIAFATKHPTNPGEALTREQALVAYTQGAAYDERTETFKGKLVPGYVADLAVLSQDIFTVAPDALAATRSVLTIVAGNVVFDASQASARPSARTE